MKKKTQTSDKLTFYSSKGLLKLSLYYGLWVAVSQAVLMVQYITVDFRVCSVFSIVKNVDSVFSSCLFKVWQLSVN